MAVAKSSDILMRVVRNGKAVEAEGQTKFIPKIETLREGFVPGRCFDVYDFNLTLGSSHAAKPSREAVEKFREEYKINLPITPPAPVGEATIVDLQPVSFTRQMDCSSPTLFTAMVGAETLDSVSVIKRKAAGTAASGEIYMRIDFYKVLLVGLDWDDEDQTIEEKWQFMCRTVTMRFRPQNPDGSLGNIVSGTWTISP